jgi:threonine/homoserine/homoserine lactone efflux protein
MTFTLFIAFVAAAIPAFFTPGPNNLMLMASSAKFGFERTIPHGLGVTVGFALMTVLVGLGLGQVFASVSWLKTGLEYAAAAYLLYLAWTLLGLKLHGADSTSKPLSFLQAAGFQWINPKAWAMAVSFGAMVVDPGPDRFVGIAILGIACLVIGGLSSPTWMLFGDRLEALIRTWPNGERIVGIVLALLVVASVVLFLI